MPDGWLPDEETVDDDYSDGTRITNDYQGETDSQGGSDEAIRADSDDDHPDGRGYLKSASAEVTDRDASGDIARMNAHGNASVAFGE